MATRDYYKILEVNDTAALADIKKSYRRLAMKYHPDRNFENKFYAQKFKEIQEAYHILSNEKRRQLYNHQLYDNRHGLNKKPTFEYNSIQAILKKIIQLRKKVMEMDPHRINKDSVYSIVKKLLSAHNLEVITGKNEPKTNSVIVDEILKISFFINHVHTKNICRQLSIVAGTDNALQKRIYDFERKQRLADLWNRYYPLAAILCVILFCLLIYKISS